MPAAVAAAWHGLSGARFRDGRTRPRDAAPSPWSRSGAGRACVSRAGRPFRQARFSMTDASALISTSYSRYLARAAARSEERPVGEE
ncbi:hypothetical protein F3J12_33015, partial [Burkholderia sp. Ax-1735]|nr:hypothetical protein [Burkholderia sp. Ax-1735]